MLISVAFADYSVDVIAFKGQSIKTEEAHLVCKKDLVRFFGDIDIEDITFTMVRNWKLELDKRVSPSTCREYVIRLRVVLQYLKSRGDDVLDYQRIPVPKRPDKVPDFISKDDVAQLIRVVTKPKRGYPKINMYKNAALISLLYGSGIRVSECTALNISDLRADNTFTVIGKGKKARLCFMDQRTRTLLDIYLAYRTDNNPALFVSNQSGGRMTANSVQRVFRFAALKSGLNAAVHPHTLRHSFATNLLRNNANMRYVQTLLGHSSLATTEMYTHVVNEDLRAVYEKYHTV